LNTRSFCLQNTVEFADSSAAERMPNCRVAAGFPRVAERSGAM